MFAARMLGIACGTFVVLSIELAAAISASASE
jgi:hypothetical protein